MKSKNADKGKAAEGLVQDWLEARSKNDVDFAWHRFPDARSARGALAAQPSDTLVIKQGEPTFLEVKETAEAKRFPRAKIRQYGALRKMHWAGAVVIVLVHRSLYQDWTIFQACDLFPDADDITPTSFPFEGKTFYASHQLALKRIFG